MRDLEYVSLEYSLKHEGCFVRVGASALLELQFACLLRGELEMRFSGVVPL